MLNRLSRFQKILLGFLAVLGLSVAVYFLPPVHSRLAWRFEALRTRIEYYINPPKNVVFVPTQQPKATPTFLPTKTPTATPLPDVPTPTPTITSTPLPEAVKLTGIIYANQCNRWNYCGPANLTMALKFWGWKGNRDDIATIIKPGENDPDKTFIDRGKSDLAVMPYEMVDFVNYNTSYRALYRYGGNVELLRRMISAGFPVIIEKGYFQRESNSGHISWMGHFSFITGFDEVQQQFIWQDSYPNRCQDQADPALVEKKGRDNLISYADLLSEWRSYNYIFIVVYPPENEADVLQALGPWSDPNWAAQSALQTARLETASMSGNELFFAWFNLGTSNVALQQYAEAASAYDRAFTLYAALGNDNAQRPYRIMWYETGPYWAYFYTGRYQDVVNLATTTLSYRPYPTSVMPKLEESLYWRAMAYYALGEVDAAYTDMRQAVYYNQNFQAAISRLAEWGVSP